MNRILSLLAGLCLLAHFSTAQFTVLGADAFGRANSLVAVPGYSSIYQNPAGIGIDTCGFLAFNYLKTVPVQGFHTTGVQGIFRANGFNFGFSIDSFGDRHYRESRAGLALARKQDRVSLGIKMSYGGMYSAGMGSRKAFLGELGMMVMPVSRLSLGLSLINFTAAGSSESRPFPAVLALGAALQPNPRISLSGQLDYRMHARPVVRLGLHYQVRDQLGLSAGINPEMRSVHFGACVRAGRYGFLYGIATHPYVGIAHHSTFIYQLHD